MRLRSWQWRRFFEMGEAIEVLPTVDLVTHLNFPVTRSFLLRAEDELYSFAAGTEASLRFPWLGANYAELLTMLARRFDCDVELRPGSYVLVLRTGRKSTGQQLRVLVGPL